MTGGLARPMQATVDVSTFGCPLLLSALLLAGCSSPQRVAPGRVEASKKVPSPATESFDGEVVGVDRVAPSDSLTSAVRLVMRPSGADPITVELAPGWYLEEQGLRFSRSDRLRVRGTPSAASDGGRAVVAWEVRTGRGSWQLRDEDGRPNWSRPRDAGR
jgi:hypothetical protein